MKRILICLDGTWNKPGTQEDGVATKTNVLKLFENAGEDRDQIKFYVKGVGTDLFTKVSGGTFGHGLFHQIKEGYQRIVDSYEPGDRLVITGFSRGAFSARSLASLVAECGILKPKTLDVLNIRDRMAIDDLWDLYKGRQSDPVALKSFVVSNCYPKIPKTVSAVAVWDTVGAMGIPWEVFAGHLPQALDDFEQRKLGFLKLDLDADIERGYHAMALDEQRVPFTPTAWDGPRLTDGTIEQVWFAGSHSNVGGGFSKTGLSDLAYDWIVRRLRARHGLDIAPFTPALEGIWDPVQHTIMDKVLDTVDLEHVRLVHSLAPRTVPAGSHIHASVKTRMTGDLAHPAQSPTPTLPANVTFDPPEH